MADREISYAIRAICSSPGILSHHDRQRLLQALLSSPEEELLEVCSLLPISNVEQLHITSEDFLYSTRKNTKFSIGDNLIQASRDKPWRKTEYISRRRGKLLAIALEPVTNGSLRPEDVIIDDVPHFRRFYIACVGPEWDERRVGHGGHDWVYDSNDEYYRNKPHLIEWSPEEVKVAIKKGCRGVLRAIESSFRGCWYKEDAFLKIS